MAHCISSLLKEQHNFIDIGHLETQITHHTDENSIQQF